MDSKQPKVASTASTAHQDGCSITLHIPQTYTQAQSDRVQFQDCLQDEATGLGCIDSYSNYSRAFRKPPNHHFNHFQGQRVYHSCWGSCSSG